MPSFLFLDIEIVKKKLSKALNTVENIMENGTFALLSKCSIFYNIFKYMIFQRRQKGLLWSKRLTLLPPIFFSENVVCFMYTCCIYSSALKTRFYHASKQCEPWPRGYKT